MNIAKILEKKVLFLEEKILQMPIEIRQYLGIMQALQI